MTFSLHAAQQRSIKAARARWNFWTGPVRSGKTVAANIAFIARIMNAGAGDIWMIGRTLGTLKRNVLEPLRIMTGGAFTYSLATQTARFAGREIYLLGASNAQAEEKIRGSTAALIYGDEITLWPEDLFRQCGLRMSLANSQFFGTTNPGPPQHWLRLFLDAHAGTTALEFTWSIHENTFLTREFIQTLEQEFSGLWYKRFILGLWVLADGAIYDFFDEAIHTIIERPAVPDWMFCAADYGTVNPTAVGIFGVLEKPKAGQPKVWLEDEYYHDSRVTQRTKTDSEYADEVIKWLGPRAIKYFIVDPSAASWQAELNKRGLPVMDARNEVLDGIRTVSNMLHTREFAIMRGCKQSIRDMGAYLWDSKAQARGIDKPIKQNDHTHDRTRYGLHTLFAQGITTSLEDAQEAYGW